MNAKSPGRRLPVLLLALTAVTGLVDAVSYLALGRVFTANMTGNVVLLGFAIAAAPGFSIERSSAALAAFVCGAMLGGALSARLGEGPRRIWVPYGFAIEAFLLLLAAAIAAGGPTDLLLDPPRLYGLIISTGLAMGARNAIVRKIGERDLTTTVLTLTITGIAADSSLAGGKNPGWARRAGSIALMFSGAVTGAWLLRRSVALPLALGGSVAALSAFAAGPEIDA